MDQVGKQLQGLRVSGRDARCLLLLPQVYVGWASQRRDIAALDALLEITASRAGLGSGSLGVARGWLFERPTRAQFQSGFALLRGLGRVPENALITRSDLLEAILWAGQAARLDREPAAVGAAAPVTEAVRRALSDVEVWLEIETGDVLADLLADGGVSEAREARGGRFFDLSDDELEHATALLDVGADDEHSAVLARGHASAAPTKTPTPTEASSPASAPFPLVRRSL
jgi:hypothetical protein